MMRPAILLVAAIALAGCAGRTATWSVDASRPVAPANLTTPCDPIPNLNKPAPMGELLEHDDLVVGMYAECAERNAAKADYIKLLEQSQ